MNLIRVEYDKYGCAWAVHAYENRFMIVFKAANGRYWSTNSEVYFDPDIAIKALQRRIKMMNGRA